MKNIDFFIFVHFVYKVYSTIGLTICWTNSEPFKQSSYC